MSESVAQINEAIETAIVGATDRSTARIRAAESSFLETVKNAKKEIAETVKEQRKAVFSTWKNYLACVGVAFFLICVSAFSFNFFKTQQAVEDYKKELVQGNGKELQELIDAYNARIKAKKKIKKIYKNYLKYI